MLALAATLVVWLADVVPAPPTQAVALVLAGIVAMLSPLVLKYVPWTGAQMTALTMLVALGIALVAAWLTGMLTLTRDGIVQALLDSSGVWTVQQLVYAALKQVAPASVGAAPAQPPLPPPA
jgi:hypothetical protein